MARIYIYVCIGDEMKWDTHIRWFAIKWNFFVNAKFLLLSLRMSTKLMSRCDGEEICLRCVQLRALKDRQNLLQMECEMTGRARMSSYGLPTEERECRVDEGDPV